MKYSETIITDDNFDDEHERMCEIIGVNYANDVDVYAKLPDGFIKHEATDIRGKKLGFDMYIKGKILPDKGSDFRQVVETGEIAVEFGNLFIVKQYHSVL